VLLGNKSDLKDKFPEHIHEKQISQFLSELNETIGGDGFYVEYLETSALTGKNIEEAFQTIGKQVVSWIKSKQS
jgi:GTPase SAR1 family protein